MSDADETEAEAPVWPRVVKLKHPIHVGSEVITELRFRRGKSGDMKNIKLVEGALPANDLTLIASRMSGQPIGVLDQLDQDDVGEVTRIAMSFYMKYLRISGMP